MSKTWPTGHRPLRPIQNEFIRRLERGDATAEQALRELKIKETTFGQWLQTPVFQRRYQRALQQIQARTASIEATVQLHHARKKLVNESSKTSESPVDIPPPDDSPMNRRLRDLHGSSHAVEKKAAEIAGEI